MATATKRKGLAKRQQDAQKITTSIIDGVELRRVFFTGEVNFDCDAYNASDGTCPDCGVSAGEFHITNCDREECPKCNTLCCDCHGEQRLKGKP